MDPSHRETNEPSGDSLNFGPFQLDPSGETLLREGEPVKIQRQPLEVLRYLVIHRDRVVSREEIYDHIWGSAFVERDKGLNFCIHEIRQALGDSYRNATYVRTIPRKGYRFVAPAESVRDARPNSPGPVEVKPWIRRSGLALTAVSAVAALAVVSIAALHDSSTDYRPAEIRTDNAQAADLYRQGNIYLSRNLQWNDTRAAIDAFEQAVELDSTFAQGWAKLAISQLSLFFEFGAQEELEPAERSVARAVRLDPDAAETIVAQGYLEYYGSRNYDAALAHLRKALELRPGDPDILIPLGFVLRRSGRWSEALESFFEAIPVAEANFELAFSIATTLQQMGEYDEAKRYHDRAIALAPDLYFPHRMNTILQLERSGDIDAAADEIEVWRRFGPEIIISSDMLARVMAPKLVSDWRRLRPFEAGFDSATTYYGLGNVLLGLGEMGEARNQFRAARAVYEGRGLGLDSTPVQGLGVSEMRLALSIAFSGDSARAVTLARRIALRPVVEADRYSGPIVRALLAKVLVVAGDHSGAVGVLEEILEAPSWLSPAILAIDPIWAPLREMPRFRVLAGMAG